MALPERLDLNDISTKFSTGRGSLNAKLDAEVLQEVPPPKAVQQIRSRLAHYHPTLKIESPVTDEVLTKAIKEKWNLILNVQDWPLVADSELGLGPHLVVQIDEFPPIRISDSDEGRIVLAMDGLNPGSHRLAAYLAYPWGEALKGPDASVQTRIHFFKKSSGTQPDLDATWLSVTSPSDLSFTEPLLIDALIWNAPLQGLVEGDDRWRLKVSINDASFLMDSLDTIWVQGLFSEDTVVQFELLDLLGEPISPMFNNQIKALTNFKVDKPLWMKSTFNSNELSRIIGESNLEDPMLDLDEELSSSIQSSALDSLQEIDDPYVAKYDLVFPRKLEK